MHEANKALRTQGNPPAADNAEIAARLRNFPLLAAADLATLTAIAEAGSAFNAPAGRSLIWAKTPADKAYIILSGEVDIKLPEGRTIRLGAGDIVGEKAIIEHKLRSATVISVTPLEVLHFTDEKVRELYDTIPVFREALDATLASRA